MDAWAWEDGDPFSPDAPVWGRYRPEWQIGEVAPWNYRNPEGVVPDEQP